jgi:RecJ-like exonuclease
MEDPLKWMKAPASITTRVGEAGALVDSAEGKIRIISHYDGDGISSAGIISRAVARCGKSFHTSMVHVLSEDDIRNLDGGFELLIVADMGSSQAEIISERLIEVGARGIILDHHIANGRDRPYSISDGGGLVEVNPRFHGIDGTSGCSGSTLSFLLSLALDPGNVDLCIYSLAGSLADRQHVPQFSELNLGIRNLAVERGFLKPMTGMPFSGRTVLEALETSNDPFIKSISGDREGAEELLSDLGIEPEKGLEELDENECKKLQSFVYVHLLNEGVSTYIVHELFRENLYSEKYGNLQDLAYAIDTCGRRGDMGRGLQVVWGSMKAYEEAFEARFDQKKQIQRMLQDTLRKGINEMKSIQWLFVEEDKLAGTIAGLSHNYLFDHTKPVLALSKDDNGKISISSRGNRSLCDKGLDLGTVMREAGIAAGGGGGGHDVAAGGHILEKNLDRFLEQCDSMVGEQMKRGKKK